MAGDPENGDDPALARTVASTERLTPPGTLPDFPRTHDPTTEMRPVDPALAATLAPEAVSSPGRATSTLTAEHPGRYVREAELGRGGMGRVLVVRDTHLGRDVAMKELLDPSPPGNATSIGSAARFLREARITGQLEHPGIVPVHELGQRADGTIYYTMKRIRGRSLASVLAEKTTLAERLTLLSVFQGVCQAVAYAHSRGVVHRDLKPDNVMVGEFGDTLVVDWGLAKVRGEAEIAMPSERDRVSGQSGRTSSVDDVARTLDGHAIGTPAYMSPEQARGELGSIDERADVWGLGAILFEILAGRPPYVGTSALDVLSKVLDDPPPRARIAAPEAPAELAAIVDRSLMRDASSRYPNAGEVAKEIGAYLEGRTVGAYEYSAVELAARFVRKHRAASLAVVTVVASIVLTSIVVYRSFLDEAQARRLAETSRDEAMREQSAAMESMHVAESAVADALLERAERALAEGDASAAAVFAAGVLVRDAGSADHGPASRHVRALSLYLEADARRRYVFERTVPGAHVRSALASDGSAVAIPTESAVRVVALDDGHERRVELRATRIRALTPEGVAVVVADASGLYDLADGHRITATATPTGAQVEGDEIVVAFADGRVRVYAGDGAERGDWASTLRGQVRPSLGPGDRGVALVSTDTAMLELWSRAAGALPQRVPLRALPYVASFSPQGDWLAVLASDFIGTLHFEGAGTTAPELRELVTRSWPTSMAWDHDGLLALYENGDHVVLRDPIDGSTQDVLHFPGANGGRVDAGGARLVWFPSESRTLLADATVMRATPAGGRDVVTLGAAVRDVQLDAPRRRLIAASLSGLWACAVSASGRLGPPTRLATLPEGVGITAHLRVADDGTAVVSTLRGALLVADGGETARVLRPAVADAAASVGLRGLALSADGAHVFVGTPTGAGVDVWSRRAGTLERTLPTGDTVAQSLAVSSDGARLAIGGRDGSVRVVRLADAHVEHTLAADEQSISSLAFSPRGERLAVGDQRGRVRLLDVADGHVSASADANERYINGLSWSGDGRWLVSAADDPAVTVLSGRDLTPARILRPAAAPISATLAGDGSRIAFHDGRSVVLFDLRLAADDIDPTALLSQAEAQAGVRLDGLALAPRAR